MSVFSSLKKEQKESLGLMQVGTFLEYFDLMLHVHMAVLLNELFFPKVDPQTAARLAAFALCSTYIMRPLGSLIFRYIGDQIGIKAAVIIATVLMSVSCVMMATLPTYSQVGIAATWLVTICRMTQGLASTGEIVGAQVYVTGITSPPLQNIAVSSITVAASMGSVSALGVASLFTSSHFNWRIAFWMGATIAVVGSMARMQLREANALTRKKKAKNKSKEELATNELLHKEHSYKEENIPTQTMVAYFLVYCGWPLSFYLTFIYFNSLLVYTHGYSSEGVIFHNFFLSLISLFCTIVAAILSYRISPLLILKIRGIFLFIFSLFLPFALTRISHPAEIFLIQAALLIGALATSPADAIFLKHFPILKRFSTASFLYALKSTFMYGIIAFSLLYATESAGPWGLWGVMLPVTAAFLWGVAYYGKLEKKT